MIDFDLKENSSSKIAKRTMWSLINSDASLITFFKLLLNINISKSFVTKLFLLIYSEIHFAIPVYQGRTKKQGRCPTTIGAIGRCSEGQVVSLQ